LNPGEIRVTGTVTTVIYLVTVRNKRCRECSRVFRPSSRHLRCPACRAWDLCGCGQRKQAESATCGSCRSEVGQANGNWKGGRTRHKAGYVMVRIPGHPRTGTSPYVFEHILVAEALLRRYLIEGESVHHINGVRDDNRPANLELWTRPQPSGIRVSDAIEWARSIYDRYVGVGAPPRVLTVSPEHPWGVHETSWPVETWPSRASLHSLRRGVFTLTLSSPGSGLLPEKMAEAGNRPLGRSGIASG